VEPKVTDQGPFVLVLNGNKIIQADKIEKADSPDKKSETSAPDGDKCAFPSLGERDVAINLIRGSVVQTPPRNIVKPNEGLTVHVCADSSKRITVQWGGARGLTRAEITGDTHGQAKAPAGGAPKAERVTRFTFAPRQAGAADLKLFEGTDTTGTPAMAVELEV